MTEIYTNNSENSELPFEILIKKALNGDIEAKTKIVEKNIGLVWSVVKKFSGRGTELEDLFQIGCIGLIKAIDKFDISFDVKFSTYAVPMIMGEIKRLLRDDGIIKVSRSIKELSLKAFTVREILTKENGCEPTVKDIAKRIGVSPEELSFAIEASSRPESLYAVNNNEKGDSKSLIEKIEAPDSFESKVTDRLLIENLIKTYPKREQEIIFMRYFKQKTQSYVAEKLGISQVQVSRIEKKLLNDMKRKIESK